MAVHSIKRAGSQSDARRERLEAYLEWLLTPKRERKPTSKAKYADEAGVTTQTLRNYSRDPWLQAEYAKRSRAENKVERSGDVVDRLYQLATDESGAVSAQAQVSAAKAFLEHTDKALQDLSVADLEDMSLDQLREALDDLERSAYGKV